jgi:hypothetical protein
VELGYHDPLCPVDHEGSARGHVRDHAQVDILDDGLKIFVLRIRAIKLQLGFQRNAVGKTAFDALLNGITGRIDEIIQELQDKIISGIGDREVLGENLIKPLADPVLRIGLQLEKILEGF